ncbi:MAG: outer membrane beta-barrel protein [Bacteroidota bacterium]|jgi:Outer membrane protein beta-barrel domain
MKRMMLLFICLVSMAVAQSQNSFYVSLGVGAGINTARTYDLYQDVTKVHPVGLGKGFAPVVRAGIFLNDFMAIELGFAYRLGFGTKIDLPGTPVGAPTGNLRFSGNMLQLVPAILIQPDFDMGSVSPYARVGVIVGVLPSITCKIDETVGNVNQIATFKYMGGVSIGGSAALGCDFDLSDMLAIYVEIYYDAMAYAPTKGKYIKYTVNGEDKLGTLATNQKEVKFVKDLTGFVSDAGSPNQELKNSYPFNNVGLNFGVKIKI